MLVVGRCRSFQVVSGHFRSFQVVPHFSKYVSIKDCERDERSKNVSIESNYQITGREQHTPSNWLEASRNDNFKVSLNKFLLDICKNDCFGGILKEKKLYITDENVCYLFKVSNGKMVSMIQTHLY